MKKLKKNPINNEDKASLKKIESSKSKLKLDQGFKPLLRGIRDCLKEMFEKAGYAKGMYHWSD